MREAPEVISVFRSGLEVEKSLKTAETMDGQVDCFVSGVFATALRLGRFVGVAPLHFVKSKIGWRVSLSKGWSVYGFCLISIVILINITTLVSDLLIDPDVSVRMRTTTLRVVSIVDVSLATMVATTAVLGAPGKMQSMIACLNSVEKIYRELNIHQRPNFSERKKFGLFIFWAIVAVFLTCYDMVLQTLNIKRISGEIRISLMYSVYYFCYWIVKMGEMLFIMVTMHVLYCFRAINDSLRTLVHAGCSEHSKRPHPGTIRRFALTYSSACDVVQEMNRCYGLIMLMMLCFFLLHHVYSPYYLIEYLIVLSKSTRNEAAHIISSVVQLVWCLDYTTNLIIYIEPCHLTHLEMEITRNLVSKLMRSTESIYNPIADELELFVKQLILNEVCYSPLNVTKMSRALVATILGSITTYLVIIIKF